MKSDSHRLLGAGLEGLAWHRENVRKSAQPELDLGGE